MCDTIRLYHRYNDEQLCDITALKPNTLVVAKYPGTEDEEYVPQVPLVVSITPADL